MNRSRSTYYVKQADFVACHNEAYLYKYEMVQDVKPGGILPARTAAWIR